MATIKSPVSDHSAPADRSSRYSGKSPNPQKRCKSYADAPDTPVPHAFRARSAQVWARLVGVYNLRKQIAGEIQWLVVDEALVSLVGFVKRI